MLFGDLNEKEIQKQRGYINIYKLGVVLDFLLFSSEDTINIIGGPSETFLAVLVSV